MRQYRGFSLLESLIALVLGALLLWIFLAVYLDLSRAQLKWQAELKMDQAAQEFELILENQIAEAGFLGCAPKTQVDFQGEALPQAWKFSGIKIVGAARLYLAFSEDPVEVLSQSQNRLTLKNKIPNLKSTAVVLFGTCDHKIFSKVEKFYFPYVYLGSLFKMPDTYREVSLWQRVVFDREDTHRRDAHHQAIEAIYEKVNEDPREEMIEGVTDFQVSQVGNILTIKLGLHADPGDFSKMYTFHFELPS